MEYSLFIVFISREVGFDFPAKLAGWLAILPSFFSFIVCSFLRIFPFAFFTPLLLFLWPCGIALRAHDCQDTKQNNNNNNNKYNNQNGDRGPFPNIKIKFNSGLTFRLSKTLKTVSSSF